MGLRKSGEYEVEAFSTFLELMAHHGAARLVLVDIPIGLPTGREGRACDREARKLLGRKRGTSVFPTPTRQTVRQAVQTPNDAAAVQKAEQRSAEKSVSKQTLAIVPKIAEVDKVMLDRDNDLPTQVREVHPEICFWALNEETAMASRKGKREGIDGRIRVLNKVEPRTGEIFEDGCAKFLRSQVARDDILDALAAAVTASMGLDHLQTLPADPPRDAKGLPMEMVFWKP